MGGEVGGRRATRIAQVWVGVVWWLGLVATVALLAWLVASPFVMSETGFTPEVGVDISLAEGTQLKAVTPASPDITLEVEEAELSIRTSDWWFQALSIGMLLPTLALMLWGLNLLRSFLGEVRSGEVFTETNSSRLTWIGWLLVAIGFVEPLTDRARAWLTLNRVQLGQGVVSPPGEWMLEAMILAGVLVLVLASAWRYGVELQRDHDLTV